MFYAVLEGAKSQNRDQITMKSRLFILSIVMSTTAIAQISKSHDMIGGGPKCVITLMDSIGSDASITVAETTPCYFHVEDFEDGHWKILFPDSSSTYKEFTIINNNLEGSYVHWFNNQRIRESVIYLNGKPFGHSVTLDKNGKIRSSCYEDSTGLDCTNYRYWDNVALSVRESSTGTNLTQQYWDRGGNLITREEWLSIHRD